MIRIRIPYFKLAWLAVTLGEDTAKVEPQPQPQPAVIRLKTEDHPLKGRLKPGWSNTLWQRRTGLWLYEWADRYHTTGARIRELKVEHDLKPPYTQAEIEAHPTVFRRYLQHQHTGMIPRQEVA